MNYQGYITELSESLGKISESELQGAIEIIKVCIDSENTVWLFGNGGSGSTASHGSCDLSKGVFIKTKKKAKVISLNDLQFSLSAWVNDHGFEQSIANMLRNLAKPKDVFIVISGSGSSNNLRPAVDAAREIGLSVITLTGFNGGLIGSSGDFNIIVQSDDMQTVENAHLTLVHWIFKCIE